MHQDVITRRTLLSGVAAFAGTTVLPIDAQAFVPALLAGINALVTLWNGYKMMEEVYERFFAERTQPIINEVVRVYGVQYVNINNYYQFRNPYHIPDLNRTEPGCEVSHRLERNTTSLCCGAQDRPIFLPTGCIIALHSAVGELRRSFREDNVFAYTRPIRYVRPVEPWRQIDASGIQLKSDISYYSTSGSVALRWLITDRNRRTCRGQYKIRDDYSNRIVTQGETATFFF